MISLIVNPFTRLSLSVAVETALETIVVAAAYTIVHWLDFNIQIRIHLQYQNKLNSEMGIVFCSLTLGVIRSWQLILLNNYGRIA